MVYTYSFGFCFCIFSGRFQPCDSLFHCNLFKSITITVFHGRTHDMSCIYTVYMYTYPMYGGYLHTLHAHTHIYINICTRIHSYTHTHTNIKQLHSKLGSLDVVPGLPSVLGCTPETV